MISSNYYTSNYVKFVSHLNYYMSMPNSQIKNDFYLIPLGCNLTKQFRGTSISSPSPWKYLTYNQHSISALYSSHIRLIYLSLTVQDQKQRVKITQVQQKIQLNRIYVDLVSRACILLTWSAAIDKDSIVIGNERPICTFQRYPLG